MIPSKSISIDIPNAISAIDYQKSSIGKNLGAYDVKELCMAYFLYRKDLAFLYLLKLQNVSLIIQK